VLHLIAIKDCYYYKTPSANQPIHLGSLLDQYTPVRTLHSADQHLLDRPRISTDVGKRAFLYKASNIWNHLPPSVRHCTSHPTFKRHLKIYMYSVYSPSLLIWRLPAPQIQLADMALLTNFYIIIIIIIIIIVIISSSSTCYCHHQQHG